MSTKLYQWPGLEVTQVGTPNGGTAVEIVQGGDPARLGPNQAVELANALVAWAQRATSSHALFVAHGYLDQYRPVAQGEPR